ncbi:unnamed protein product, partial [Meganyctiphanes norvegica]
TINIRLSLLLYHLICDRNSKWAGQIGVKGHKLPNIIKEFFSIHHSLVSRILTYRENYMNMLSNTCVTFRVFEDYGKDFMKAQKLHPDAFVQMALQLAYIRQNGKPAPTYETATTRQFYNGRTETMRSCTVEAVEWAHAMLSRNNSQSEKKLKLVRAVERHKELMAECQKGEGVDRHLMGLSLLAMEAGMDTPQIFTDIAYTKSDE